MTVTITPTNAISERPRRIGRLLLQLPVLLYRLGLGDLVNSARIMILTTRGSKTGRARHTALEYRRHGSKTYVVSAWGEDAHWFRNLTASSGAIVQQGRRTFYVSAQPVENEGEAVRVLHLFRRGASLFLDPFFARRGEKGTLSARELPRISRQVAVVRLEERPAPPVEAPLMPVPRNLVWIWPLVASVSLAFAILIAFTRGRSRGLFFFSAPRRLTAPPISSVSSDHPT